jgi:cyclopropane-fatty-acyl-phospholipid synthase
MSPSPAIAGKLANALAPLFPDGLPMGLRAWDGSEAGKPTGPAIALRSPLALRYALWSPGELGLVRAYVSGALDIDGDLTDGLRLVRHALPAPPPAGAVVRTALAALGAIGAAGGFGRRPPLPSAEARLRGRRHTRRRDADVIAHHYDLSNALYELLLDDQMAYSCAYWTDDDPGYTLADAQRDKLDLICRKLELRPGSRLLDVGCGWGALAIHAADKYGARVTGITLSEQQRAYATARVQAAGMTDLVRIERRDYRDLPTIDASPFDAVSTIEMGEHVGKDNYPQFLRILHDALQGGGRLLIQQMSRRSRPGGGRFIESYIAPDMHMRPLAETVGLIEENGFEVCDVEALREHYVRTIRAWLETFDARHDDVVALVGAEQARVWRLYLAGSALAFEDGRMGVDQILAVRTPVGLARARVPAEMLA